MIVHRLNGFFAGCHKDRKTQNFPHACRRVNGCGGLIGLCSALMH